MFVGQVWIQREHIQAQTSQLWLTDIIRIPARDNWKLTDASLPFALQSAVGITGWCLNAESLSLWRQKLKGQDIIKENLSSLFSNKYRIFYNVLRDRYDLYPNETWILRFLPWIGNLLTSCNAAGECGFAYRTKQGCLRVVVHVRSHFCTLQRILCH